MARPISLAEDSHRERLLNYARQRLRREIGIAFAEPGSRRKLNRVCCSLAGAYRALPLDDLWLVLQEWLARHGSSWPEEEARRVLSSAARWVRNQPEERL